jgi:integrase
VDYYIKHSPVRGKKTFAEVSKEFLTSRKNMGCKKTTMDNYASYMTTLNEEYSNVNVSEITLPEIEDWLSESTWQPRTRKNYIVTMTTVFNFAIKREYCVSNPAAKIDRPILDDIPPGILTLDQTCTLLTRSMEEAPLLTDGLAIGLFAGLRRSELCALDWSEINRESRLIEVKASKAKTRKRRLVTISDNLAHWLDRDPQESGPVVYRLVNGERKRLSVDMFGEALRALVSPRGDTDETKGHQAIVDPWPHNAIRHSFGSYYYGHTKNENFTAAEMGNSPDVVMKDYRELVDPQSAAKYWNIIPDNGIAKIVSSRQKK